MNEQKEQQTKAEPATETRAFKHIVRIANVDVPGDKSIRVALTKIKGVGVNFAQIVCSLANVPKNKKTGELTETQVEALSKILNNPSANDIPVWVLNRQKDYNSGEDQHLLTGTLNFVKENDLRRLKKIKSYKGVRHQKKLPVRGQRTRSNFRRSKGKVVGVKKKTGK